MSTWRTKSGLAIFVALLLSQAVSSQQAIPRSIPPGLLAQMANGATASYIVVMRDRADLSAAAATTDRIARGRLVYQALKAVADASQRPLLDALRAEAAAGRVRKIRAFFGVNAIGVTSNEAVLRRLAAFPQVEEILELPIASIPQPMPGVPQAGIQSVEWNIAKVRAPEVWARGFTGQGIVVASLDTGVEFTHSALVGHYRGNLGRGTFDHNYNWWDATGTCPSAAIPCDDNEHGTHTTGTMVGSDGGSNQIGVAPGATWIGCKALLSGGAGIVFDLLECGDWMLAPWDLNHANPNPDRRPHIVNNSWGLAFGGFGIFQTMINNWRAAGIFPAFAAGNAGSACGTVGSPGDYPQSFASGALDMSDNIAGFSSRGPSLFGVVKPDVSAPGVNVWSSVPGGGYAAFSGTSMASPHTAGIVALLWSEFPNLSRDITSTERKLRPAAVILNSVEPCGTGPTAHPNNTFGWGRIDAVEDASPFPVYTNRSVYHAGDQFAMSISLVNPFPTTLNADAYLGFRTPSGEISIVPLGTLAIPPSLKLFDQTLLSFVVSASQPTGSYLSFTILATPGSDITNPANLLGLDFAPFAIQ